MKDYIACCCVAVLLCTSCQEPSSDLDNSLLDCYETAYKTEGYDLKAIIEDYEKTLIREGVLKDGSGEGYLEVWRKINSDKDYRIAVVKFQQYDPWHKVDKETGVAVYQCEFEKIDSLKMADSRWERVFSTSESPESPDNPGQVYRNMVENMSEADFNSYYFRLKMFQLFDMVNSNSENGL